MRPTIYMLSIVLLHAAVIGGLATLVVSLRRRAARRLADSRRDLLDMVGSISDVAYSIDIETNEYRYLSPAFERLFGWPVEHVARRGARLECARQIMGEEAFARKQEAIVQARSGVETDEVTMSWWGTRRDGTQVFVEDRWSAWREGDRVVAIHGVLRDATERRLAEEALRRANELADAANQRLEHAVQHANRMTEEAERADRAKSQFLANMSHEIRTPMNGIIGMTGLLLEMDLAPEQRQFTETIHSCSEALLSLINDILDFSKIEAGRLELEALEFDVPSLLEDALDLMSLHAAEKQLELVCDIDSAVPSHLRGDPGRVRQVLVNLVGNAIKFTPSGEVSVTIRVDAEEAERVRLRCEVKDTGIGIPADVVGRLFAPFTQADSSTRRKYGGTGLGLSISKRLTEAMGGEIGVESEVGHGSTFWFTAWLERVPGVVAEAPPPDFHGERVLIVDDNATNRRLLLSLLTRWKCRAEEASDGPTALERMREAAASGDPFKVAFLDYMMPLLDGEELARAVRSTPALAATPLALVSSAGRHGATAHLARSGFDAWLHKPVKREELKRCLARLIAKGAAAAPATARAVEPTPARAPEEAGPRRTARILVAEDNRTNQVVALKMLHRLGYQADAVLNGVEALAALHATAYDLVLMDCQMPEMDGFEATRRIRELDGDAGRTVPVVAMTANAMTGDREICLAAGMNDYIAKPVAFPELARVLERWLPANAEQSAVA